MYSTNGCRRHVYIMRDAVAAVTKRKRQRLKTGVGYVQTAKYFGTRGVARSETLW